MTNTDTSGTDTELVEFSRIGGFAGNNDHLVLYRDGSAKVTRKDYTTWIAVPEETVTTVEQLLANAGITHLSDEYPAPQKGADLLVYTDLRGKDHSYGRDCSSGRPSSIINLPTDIIITNAPDDISPPSTPKFFYLF